MSYYYARADENDVLCVGEVESDNPTEGATAHLAEAYPDFIYFEYTKPIVYRYYTMEIDDLGVLCVGYQGRPQDEERVAVAAEMNPDVIFFAIEM